MSGRADALIWTLRTKKRRCFFVCKQGTSGIFEGGCFLVFFFTELIWEKSRCLVLS